LTTSDTVIVAAQEAFLLDTRPASTPIQRCIQVKLRRVVSPLGASCHCDFFDGTSTVSACRSETMANVVTEVVLSCLLPQEFKARDQTMRRCRTGTPERRRRCVAGPLGRDRRRSQSRGYVRRGGSRLGSETS
jgi:hypothetical protein